MICLTTGRQLVLMTSTQQQMVTSDTVAHDTIIAEPCKCNVMSCSENNLQHVGRINLMFFRSYLSILASGPILNRRIPVTIVRLILYVVFWQLIFVPTMFPKWWQLISPITVALVVLAVQLSVYLLNRVIDKSIELSPPPPVEAPATIERPEGISIRLWQIRSQFLDGMSTEDVLMLIHRGYDADEVFSFYTSLQNPAVRMAMVRSLMEEREHARTPDTREYYVKCGERICCKLHVTREDLNAVFPGDLNILFVIISPILAGCTVFMVNEFMRNMNMVRLWVSLICGGAVYSLIIPPEIEAYSTTRGDESKRFTRCLTLLALASIWRLSLMIRNEYPHITIRYFDLDINWTNVHEVIEFVCELLIVFFPFVMFCFIGGPLTMIMWTLEWLGRYVFGHGGYGSWLHCISRILWTVLVCVIANLLFVFLESDWNGVIVVVGLSMLLQVPLELFRDMRLVRLLPLILVRTAFAAGAAISGNYIKFNVAAYVALGISLLLGLVYPYMLSYNTYVLFNLRIVNGYSKLLDLFRLLAFTWSSAMLLGSLHAEEPECPFVFFVILCIIVTNKALCEPHVFATGMTISVLSSISEMHGFRASMNLFLSMTVSRKLWSVCPMMRYYMNERPFLLIWEFASEGDTLERLLAMLFMKAVTLIPFIDHSFAFPGFVWSVITGAPLNAPDLLYIHLPACPRPNIFWERNNGQSLDTSVSLRTTVLAHPIEAPMYPSLASDLKRVLVSAIQSGQLGIVDSNDIFLFVTDSLCCFVHVVALDAYTARFQIRGLEYQSRTTCHLTENRVIAGHLEENCLDRGLRGMMANWVVRQKNFELNMFRGTRVALASIFIKPGDAVEWAKYAFVYTTLHIANIEELLADVNETEEAALPANVFHDLEPSLSIGDATISKITRIWMVILRFLRVDKQARRFEWERLYVLFEGNPGQFHPLDDGWLWGNNRLLSEIVYPFARRLVLTLAMVEASLAPELTETDELRPFFEQNDQEYVCAPIVSDEFIFAFTEPSQARTIITIHKGESPSLLHFHMGTTSWNVLALDRESVRSYWSSEAQTQLLYASDDSERNSIQSHEFRLHNLIIQSCNMPLGYAAFISPVCTSVVSAASVFCDFFRCFSK